MGLDQSTESKLQQEVKPLSECSLSLDISRNSNDAERITTILKHIDLKLTPGRYHLIIDDQGSLHIKPVANKLGEYEWDNKRPKTDFDTQTINFSFKGYGISCVVLHNKPLKNDPLVTQPGKAVSAETAPVAHLLPRLQELNGIPVESRTAEEIKELAGIVKEIKSIFVKIKADEVKAQERKEERRLAELEAKAAKKREKEEEQSRIEKQQEQQRRRERKRQEEAARERARQSSYNRPTSSSTTYDDSYSGRGYYGGRGYGYGCAG